MHRKTRGTHLLLANPRDLASARTKDNPISLRSTVPRYLHDSVHVACLDDGGQEHELGTTSLAMVLQDVVGFSKAVLVVDQERFARPAAYWNGVIVRALHFRIALGTGRHITIRSTSHRHFLPSWPLGRQRSCVPSLLAVPLQNLSEIAMETFDLSGGGAIVVVAAMP